MSFPGGSCAPQLRERGVRPPRLCLFPDVLERPQGSRALPGLCLDRAECNRAPESGLEGSVGTDRVAGLEHVEVIADTGSTVLERVETEEASIRFTGPKRVSLFCKLHTH